MDRSGQVNIAPLGPIVYPAQSPNEMPSFLLRPYAGSTTCANLLDHGRGVIHVIDDVLLLAQTAIGRVDASGLVCPISEAFPGYFRLKDCHRWFAVEVQEYGGTPPRHELMAHCIAEGTVRPFFGFNRAKHAVIEAAIMATRIGMLEASQILRSLEELKSPVEKTAGPDEKEAFYRLESFIRERLTNAAPEEQTDQQPSEMG